MTAHRVCVAFGIDVSDSIANARDEGIHYETQVKVKEHALRHAKILGARISI